MGTIVGSACRPAARPGLRLDRPRTRLCSVTERELIIFSYHGWLTRSSGDGPLGVHPHCSALWPLRTEIRAIARLVSELGQLLRGTGAGSRAGK